MVNITTESRSIIILSKEQTMFCYEDEKLYKMYPVSTGKNGMGEQTGSECTPRGKHRIYSVIGLESPVNSVFVARKWTGEYYTPELAMQFPDRDWILTRILQLDGMESGYNQGGNLDSLQRYIYIHGTPDSTQLGIPGSHGCVRMRNTDVIELAAWVMINTLVWIK